MAGFPSLRLPEDAALLTNLPAQVSSFIGREAELAEVRALVAGARLVTLTGTGGAGKTRLGLQVAARLLDDCADGVWFADLAPLGDPELVAVAVADVLGVRVAPGRPVLDALVAGVGGRRVLVVLDNCEHVIEACAKLADALLRGCQNLALLATSREPLGIDGERVYRVPTMRVPAEGADAAGIHASESVRLLADRAAAQGAPLASDELSAPVAGRICRRLDGIPLAIELAAARLRAMSADELEARLDERFALLTGGSRTALPRQQTLRAMIDWSWELLTGAEQTVLARLSAFAGGFGLAAAEAVAAGPDVPAAEVLGLLGALVDKSLVQFELRGTGPARYRLLETVRQYAAGQLDLLGPAAAVAARVAHRDYYLALAEEAAARLVTADQGAWLDRVDAEQGNLRAAVAFSLIESNPEPGLRLAIALRRYWKTRGNRAEGCAVLRALLDRPAAQGATRLRGWALSAAASLLEQTGSYAITEVYCQEALAIARTLGDEELIGQLLGEQAWTRLRQGQADAALPLVEQGLVVARRLGDPRLRAFLLSARSYAREVLGDLAGSVRDQYEGVRLLRAAGDRLRLGRALGNLGSAELATGDLDAARSHLAEGIDIARALGDRSGLFYHALNLGWAHCLDGSREAAGALFAEAFEVARSTGTRSGAAYALLGLALAGHAGAGSGWSARLHGAADQAFSDLGETLEPLESRLAERDRERLRAAMGDQAFEAEYAAGRALDEAQVLAAVGRPAAASAQPRRAGSSTSVTVLTRRELDVLRLVAQGLSNAGIAKRLVLSEHTVHRHLANILRKLGLPSRAAAATWGVRAGLV
jgi:predicted ATPase/DNA-binding CsgD family transcriptional regulator